LRSAEDEEDEEEDEEEEDEEDEEEDNDDDDSDSSDSERWHHPGDSVAIPDDFPVDEDEDALWDTKANRRDMPESFQWTCCGGDMTAKGCTRRIDSGVPRRNGDNGSVSSDTVSDPDAGLHRHEGDLEVEWTEWPGFDPSEPNLVNTEANRRKHPRRFMWTCCGCSARAKWCNDEDEEFEEEEEEEEDEFEGVDPFDNGVDLPDSDEEEEEEEDDEEE
jgi:hypothetical protein